MVGPILSPHFVQVTIIFPLSDNPTRIPLYLQPSPHYNHSGRGKSMRRPNLSQPGASQPPRRPSPPPLIRKTPQGPCGPCAPNLPTPFGGPASGLWPSGRGMPRTPSGMQVTPSPTPQCSDTIATIFADCFADCNGTITGVSPGPVCGWTFTEFFGVFGGTIIFTPGQMSFFTANPIEFPGATKPIPAPLVTVNGVSGQFDFTEYPTPPNLGTDYTFFVTNQDLSEVISIGLFGDGTLIIAAGDPAAIPTYTGTWTPTLSAHRIYFSIDLLGVPSLFIDGVAVALTFAGLSTSPASGLPANVVSLLIGGGDVTPGASPVRSVFLTAGNVGPNTVFCCP